jgi:hypothetical protein
MSNVEEWEFSDIYIDPSFVVYVKHQADNAAWIKCAYPNYCAGFSVSGTAARVSETINKALEGDKNG